MENKKVKKRRANFSPQERMEIVKLHYLEGLSRSELARMYGTAQPVVSRIIRNFAAENENSALLMKKKPTDNLTEENKALRREVLELKRRLYDETMRADFYDTMIDVAEELFGIEIIKKVGSGQSKGCMKTK